MNKSIVVLASVLAMLAVPVAAEAQGIVGGARTGAAGPVGGIVVVVGGAVGGVVGGARGVPGLPRRGRHSGYVHHHRRRHGHH